MRITLMIFVVLLSGCEAINTMVKPQQSSGERFAERVEQWSDSKAQELLNEMGGGVPLLSEKKVSIIPASEISVIYAKMESGRLKMESDLDRNNENMAELRKIYDISRETAKDINETQEWLRETIAMHANDFHESVVQPSSGGRMIYDGNSYKTDSLISYCKSHNIKESECKSEPHNRTGNPIAVAILLQHLVDKYPEYRNHIDWLNHENGAFRDITDKAFQKGVEFESKMFFVKASAIGCKGLNNFNSPNNSPLAHQIGYSNFRPNKSSVYDVGHFKVLQSHSDGVLLSTTYPGGHNAPLIFAITRKKYTDGYTFQPGEQFVCVAGVKEYVSVLGAKKRVLSFRAINDANKYYFLMKSFD